jgi:hypothetical protein
MSLAPHGLIVTEASNASALRKASDMYAPEIIRTATATLIAPALALTGKRFSKIHRQHDTPTFFWVSTVLANRLADKIRGA